MFITTINGKENKVFFKYDRENFTYIQKNGELGTGAHPVDTTCFIVDKATNSVTATGYTKCHPGENFEYCKGRKYAMERAMASIKLDRKQRAAVWMDYHSRTI